MSFKPDLGRRLQSDGLTHGAVVLFYGCRLFSLTVLTMGRFSSFSEVPYAGEYHALSLDFDLDQLLQILENAPADVLEQLQTELLSDLETPRSIDLVTEVTFDVRARLGTVQQGAYEVFVPLVADEILHPKG